MNSREQDNSQFENHILYDGSKAFWTEHCKLDVTIALHANHNVLEVVMYDACMGVEFPRVYFDYLKLKSKMDVEEYHDRVSRKKEKARRLHLKISQQILEEEALDELIAQFLLDAINVKGKPGSLGLFTLLVFGVLPGVGNIPNSCERPLELLPLHVEKPLFRTVEDVRQQMHDLRPEDRIQYLEGRFYALTAIDAFHYSAKSSPLSIRMDHHYSEIIQQWRIATRKVISSLTSNRMEELIMNSSLSDWYAVIKKRNMALAESNGHALKLWRKVHTVKLLVSKPAINETTIMVSCFDFDLPDIHASHRQRRSMNDFRQHRRMRSEGSATSVKSPKHSSKMPFKSGVDVSARLQSSAKRNEQDSDIQQSRKSTKSWKQDEGQFPKISINSSTKQNIVSGTLSPRRVAHDDPYFKKENEKTRSLHSVAGIVAVKSEAIHMRESIHSSSQPRSTSLSPVRLTSGDSKSKKLFPEDCKIRTKDGKECDVNAGVGTSPIAQNFANHMSKLEQNVTISKFGSAHRRSLGKRLGSNDDFEVNYS